MRRQYRGNAQAVINGMGTVTGGYVNPPLEHFWLIDYRLSDPAGDGKRTLDPGRDLLLTGVSPQQLPVAAVLMATWYATQALLLLIDSEQKSSYGPLKDNRHGADARGPQPYQRVAALTGKAPE